MRNLRYALNALNVGSTNHRLLRGLVEPATLRTANYNGVDHIVAPVVMLYGGAVIRPLESTGPEMVPADVLSQAPAGWNGRPVIPDHPSNASTANTPEILQQNKFGEIFNAQFVNNKLKAEVYLNPERAESIADAQLVMAKLSAGELVELSVGCYITLRQQAGISNGRPYQFVWLSIVPDHLALGLNGSKGACSVEMGCGGPRNNSSMGSTVIDNGKESGPMKIKRKPTIHQRSAAKGLSDSEIRQILETALAETETAAEYLWVDDYFAEDSTVIYSLRLPGDPLRELYHRQYTIEGDVATLSANREAVKRRTNYILASDGSQPRVNVEYTIDQPVTGIRSVFNKLMSMLAADDLSDVELRGELHSQLQSTVPGFDRIEQVMPGKKLIIYSVYTEDDGRLRFYSQTYKVRTSNGSTVIALNDDQLEVEQQTSFVPVKAGTVSDQSTTQLTCQCNKGDTAMKDKAKKNAADGGATIDQALIDRAVKTGLFTADDPTMEALGAEKLTEIVDKFEQQSKPDTNADTSADAAQGDNEPVAASAKAKDGQPKPNTVTIDEKEWNEVRAASNAYHQQLADKKGALVKSLVAAQKQFDEKELGAFSIAQLEKLATLSNVKTVAASTCDFTGQGIAEPPTEEQQPRKLRRPYTEAMEKIKAAQAN